MNPAKTIGIVAHSAEGGALCFLSACRHGQAILGAHMHPEIVVSAIPMGLSMPAWESGNHVEVATWLKRGVDKVASAGADFFVCPDNTAHIVLEQICQSLPIPGLNIADVVALEMKRAGMRAAGLLGTLWTMSGPVYPRAMSKLKQQLIRPPAEVQNRIDGAIFNELCQGVFLPSTKQYFIDAIGGLAAMGADCVVLGCTEIPLIVHGDDSPIPVLDSTRLLAKCAVQVAVSDFPLDSEGGWIKLDARSTAPEAFS